EVDVVIAVDLEAVAVVAPLIDGVVAVGVHEPSQRDAGGAIDGPAGPFLAANDLDAAIGNLGRGRCVEFDVLLDWLEPQREFGGDPLCSGRVHPHRGDENRNETARRLKPYHPLHSLVAGRSASTDRWIEN